MLMPSRKEPLKKEHLVAMYHVADGTPLRGSRKVHWASVFFTAWRAFVNTARTTGSRKPDHLEMSASSFTRGSMHDTSRPGDRAVKQGPRGRTCGSDHARAGESSSRPAPWFCTIRDVKAVPSGVVGRTTIGYHGFRRGVQKRSLRLFFLVKDSLCMTPCNDIDQAHFCLKKMVWFLHGKCNSARPRA